MAKRGKGSKAVEQKVPVTMRALIARMNRKLKSDAAKGNYENLMLKVVRGTRAQMDLGQYYFVDFHSNTVAKTRVDPVAFGRKMGVLQPWEEVYDE